MEDTSVAREIQRQYFPWGAQVAEGRYFAYLQRSIHYGSHLFEPMGD